MRRLCAAIAFLALGPIACGRSSLWSYDDVGLGSDAGVDLARPPIACTPGEIVVTSATPAVMLVLDRSGSMRSTLPGSGGRSRWRVLSDSLATVLPSVDGVIALGALLYPQIGSGNIDTCTVGDTPSFSPAPGQTAALVSLMRASEPGGATPTADAVSAAAQHLLAIRASGGGRALVVATDGAPDCNASLDARTCVCATGDGCRNRPARCLDDDRTVARIASYAAAGLPTYVIGIAADSAIFAETLDRMAAAGERPRAGAHGYYSARSESELEDALIAIRDQVGACTFLTTSVPDETGAITLQLDGSLVPFDETGAHGWRWGSRSNGELVLSADYCALVGSATRPSTLLARVECGDAG